MGFTGKSMPIGYPLSVLKTHIQITLYGLNKLYSGIHAYTYTYAITINKKKKDVMSLKVSTEEYMIGLKGGKGRGKYCSYIIISKIKKYIA